MEVIKLTQLSNSNSCFLQLRFSGRLRRVNETHVLIPNFNFLPSIVHFQVSFRLCFKTSPRAKLFV